MILCASAQCRAQEPTQGNSLLCDDCRDRLHLTLRWVEFHLAHLTTVKVVRPQMVSTAGGFESASPANDDIIVMLDPRSAAVGVGRFHTGPDDDPKPPLSAPAVLGGWALMAWEGRTPPSLREFMPRPCTVRDAVSELLTALGWITEQDWVHDFADEVNQLNRQLRAATGEAPPKPVASCIRATGTGEDGQGPPQLCGGGIVLWEHPATDTRPASAGARCLVCSASYTGFELIDLAKQVERRGDAAVA